MRGLKSKPGDALTNRQAVVLGYIREFRAMYGYAPTVREIGEALGIKSPNGVIALLKPLEKKGRISRDPRRARSIVVLGEEWATWGGGEGI